ncbi:MAG: Ig-like domain-containing protein, partial [Pseudomonadota bacterium]
MNLPLLPEQLVNTFTSDGQTNPDLTELSDGRIVTVWTSANQDGSSNAVVARVFDEDGSPLGNEFIVNTDREGSQFDPAISATDDGGFVVVWTGQDDSGNGVFAQRYDASAAPVGGETMVADTSNSTQNQPDVAGLPGGGYVVSWFSDFDDTVAFGRDVRAQIYDATGAELGSEFTVNSTGAGVSNTQEAPRIEAIEPSAGPNGLTNGGFVVTFRDSSTNNIFTQVYDVTGAAVGGEIQVNTNLATSVPSDVVGLVGGRFVAVWTDNSSADGSGQGVFAQIHEGDGTAVGSEFQVNTEFSSTQNLPSVTATADGGFAISWTAATSAGSGDGSGTGIASRSFDANGVETEPERIVNEETSGTQTNSAILGLSNGNLFVTWQSVTSGTAGDGSSSGIFARLLGDPSGFSQNSIDPQLEAVNASRTFDENSVNAAPQKLDADGAVALSDADSADFDGGRLLVSRIAQSEFENDYQPQDADGQDRLGLDTSGTVGIIGSDVLVGGVIIGTLVSDGDAGAPLEVSFNANATVAAVEALIENLTYQNLSDDPRDQTVVAIAVEDGDGGAIDPIAITINISPDEDRDGRIRGEVQVNTVTANAQNDSAIATLADGGYISVWVSVNQDNPGDSSPGVFAQRYNSDGVPVGGEFPVNETVTSTQNQPEVTGLSDGGYVIVWFDANTGTVKLNRYDAAGNRTVTELDVVTNTASTQNDPDVQGLSNGGYVVTWTTSNAAGGDGSGNAVKGQLYNAAGAPVGSEFLVNEQTIGSQSDSAIAALDAGRFVVTWTDSDAANGDGSSTSVAARIFLADGTPETVEFRVNSTTFSEQSEPAVTALANGDFVVVWRTFGQDQDNTYGIYYQRYDSTGTPIGGEIRVNEYTPGNSDNPEIIALDTGGFVVSWNEDTAVGSGQDVLAVVFDADGTRLDSDVLINTEVTTSQDNAVMTALPGGNYVVQWTSQTSGTAGDGNGEGIFQQIFGDPAEISSSLATAVEGLPDVVTLSEADVNAGALVFPVGVARVFDADSPDLDGGQLRLVRVVSDPLQSQFNAPDGETQDNLSIALGGRVTQSADTFLVDGVAVATIESDGQNGSELIFDFLPGATLNRVEALLGALTYTNPSDDPRDSRTYALFIEDGDGGAAPSIVFDINLTGTLETGTLQKAGPETQVSALPNSNQTDSAIATLSDGGWVVVWGSDQQDGSNSGVFAQRYDANGNAVGVEFQVPTTTLGFQDDPAVAGLEDGGWVIAWTGQGTGDTAGVFYTRYDANGVATESEVLVNTTTSGGQDEPSVIGLTGGGFAIAFTGSGIDNSGDGIALTIFASDGSVVANEMQVNTGTSSTQNLPDISELSDGRVAVTWTSSTGDGSGFGIFAAIFNADGTSSVAEFQVNTVPDSTQTAPAIAATPDGGFVIVWTDFAGQDGNSNAIVAQRFDSMASSIDGPFVVNDITSGSQNDPDVSVASDGSFVITWADSSSADGSNAAVFLQAYDATGARVDSATLVNTTTTGSQNEPSIAALPGGNYAVTFSSLDESGRGVFQQIFGDPAGFALGQAPTVQGLSATRTISEADANAGLVLLDDNGTVAVGANDLADFDGGTLKVSVDLTFDLPEELVGNDGPAQDQFGLVGGNRGNGDVQTSGSDVLVDGVIIGTFTASDGLLNVEFNASASVEDVEAVVSAIGYQTASEDPMPLRRVQVDLTDGDGRSAPAQFIDLTVSPEIDSPLSAQDERRVNAHTQGNQSDADIVELAGGGFVVTWQSFGQFSPTDGAPDLYFQLYNAAGVPVGSETIANATAALSQTDPAIAATPDGGFIIVWEGQNLDNGIDNNFGIIAQKYDANGVPQGAESVVNTTVSGAQFDPQIAVDSDGSYVIVYTSGNGDGSSSAILSRNFDSSGNPQDPDQVVNVENVSGGQSSADVAYYTDGTATQGYAVVFTSPTSGGDGDGNVNGVLLRLFDTSGMPTGPDVLVNTNTIGNQEFAKVAGLSGGGFVVVWVDDRSIDGDRLDLYAQLYDSNGATVGSEFRLNTETARSQTDVSVSATANGGFAVSFTSDGSVDGSLDAVLLATFDATGQRLDQQVVANQEFSSNQSDSALVGRANGDILVAYTSVASAGAGDGSSNGVFLREFTAAPGADISPNLSDFNRLVQLRIDDFTGGNTVLLDDAVAFEDATSADFDGGTVELYYTSGNVQPTDQLSVIAGDGVTVSGSDISVNATIIGTIDATLDGANGTGLRINLNASATASDVQAVLQRLGYGSTELAANITASDDKSVGIIVTDGDGGQSEPDSVFLDVIGPGSSTNSGLALRDFGLSENEAVTQLDGQLESVLLAGPQRIDSDIDLDDFAGTGFDGGFLDIANVSTFSEAFKLSVDNVGTGTGQIGFDGTTATYQGTAIGTIDATRDGEDGQGLRINLNASATAEGIEALAEAFTLALDSGTSVLTPSFRLTVSNGSTSTTAQAQLPIARDILLTSGQVDSQVNTFTSSDQQSPRVAALSDDSYVVVWTSNGQDSDVGSVGIFAQVFSEFGDPIGLEFQVNDISIGNQSQPRVTGLDNGTFVVLWTEFSNNRDGSGSGVFGQVFDNSGAAQGTVFQVNEETSSSQSSAQIAELPGGGFLTVWTSVASGDAGDGNGNGIFARVHTADGTPVAGEFQVNTTTPGGQDRPRVTELPDGDIIIVWEERGGSDGNSTGVVMQRIDSDLGLVSIDGTVAGPDEIFVNTTTVGTQEKPDVGALLPSATLPNGGFVVVWQGPGENGIDIFAQIYDIGGVAQGGEFIVNDGFIGTQNDPVVVGRADGGFSVVWTDPNGLDGSGQGVFGQDFNADGSRSGFQYRVNSEVSSTQFQPDAAVLNNGSMVVAFAANTSSTSGDGSGFGVSQQIFDAAGRPVGAESPILEGFGGSVTFSETDVNSGLQLLDVDGAISLTDPDSANFDGGTLFAGILVGSDTSFDSQLGANSGSAQNNIGLVQANGVTISGASVLVDATAIGTIVGDGQSGAALEITLTASATPELVERVIAQLGYSNASDNPESAREIAVQVTDGSGGSTGSQVLTINVTPVDDRVQQPVGGEDQVNTFTEGQQIEPATAAVYDSLGEQIGYVVVWQSLNQDQVQEGSTGVYAQLYGLDGAPVGAEFRINEETFQNERDPAVVGLKTGGFAVVWEDGSGQVDVELRIFDETGSPVTGEIPVDVTGLLAYAPDVAAKSNGNVLVAYTDWSGSDGNGYGIFVQEFDNTGTLLTGSPIQINTEVSGNQDFSSITVLADDRYVVTWQSPSSDTAGDGSSNGVIGRIMNADGTPATGEFIVNSVTAGSQSQTEVTALEDGGFVVVWTDTNSLDGSQGSVNIQRYDATGVQVGSQLRVNETTGGDQFAPEIVALDNGGWVVVWSDGNGIDGSGAGVFGQVYDASGNRVDGQFQVNTEFSSTQSDPVVSALPDGGFTVVWTSITSGTAGDGSGQGIFQQVFANPALVTPSADPALIGVSSSLTLEEADVNAGLQAIAPSVAFGDLDSANLADGQLTVAIIDNDLVQPQFQSEDGIGQDQLGLLTTGNVSINATNVSVGGTVIGTLDSDGANGAQLVVTFNANATPVLIEQLIEAVGYSNSSDDPTVERLISLQVTDGNGGAVREVVNLTITPETDGGVPVDDEAQTNSFTVGSQGESAVATLADGGYVIVWTSVNQDATGDGSNGVFLQRYDSAGAPVGGEIQVNTTTVGSQNDAHVIGLSNGGYVVAWTDTSTANSPNSDQEVTFQIYGANGAKVGSETILETDGIVDPNSVRLAVLDSGDFVLVAATRDELDFSNSGFQIVGQRFDDQGGALAGRFEVPVSGNSAQLPDVAVQANGTFAVVYVERGVDDPSDNDFGVLVQRYAADGSQIGGPNVVNTFADFDQAEARIAALDGGGYVVVWASAYGDISPITSSYGVYAQVLDANGAPVGPEFLVNELVSGTQSQPDVAGLEGGGFAIVYTDFNSADGSSGGVYAQEYSADGTRVDDPILVNQETSGDQTEPSIAALPGGNYVVSFTSNTSLSAGDGSGNGVFHRIIGDPADFGVGGNPILDGINTEVDYAENDINGVPRLIDANGAVAVSDVDSMDFDGGSILVSNVIASAPLINQINAPDDLTQDVLGLRQSNGITITGGDVFVDAVQVGSIVQNGQNGTPFEIALNANADAEVVELLVENLTYRNISDDPLEVRQLRIQITDGDGGASEPVVVQINITPTPDGAVQVGGERVVETSTGGSQEPVVAELAGTDGDFVVVWTNTAGADGTGFGILAQRFDVNGNPVARDGAGLPSGTTDEFVVNATTSSNQSDPDVASFSDGSFVVVWVADGSQDGSASGVFAQLFNADGSTNGGEIQINSLVPSSQNQPQVTALTNDSFVVSFTSATSVPAGDGSGNGIVARVFDNAGVAAASEFVVNTAFEGAQDQSDITALSNGGFVITWTSDTNNTAGDGSQDGVFAQVFDASATPVGGEFQVNTLTAGNQTASKVVELANGNLVFVWTDAVADQSSNGVFAQIYTAAGATVTDQFRVNDQRISTQFEPDIAALDTGGFVITWTDTASTDGSGQGVFAQQYNSTGNRIDSQIQVNSTTNSTQNQPSVEGLEGGGFVVAFNNDSGTVGEILLQVYGNALPTVSPVAAEGDEDTAIVLDAAIFDAGFADPDGNTLQAIRIETFPSNGALTLNSSPVFAGQEVSRADLIAGNLVYTGSQDFNGADSFLWSGSDGIGFSNDIVAANITVDPVNDAPALEAGADTTVSEGQNLSRTLTIGDPDADNRTYTVNYNDGSAVEVFNTSSTAPVLNHVFSGEGTFTVSVQIDDNAGEANSVEVDTFEVTVVNANPNAQNDFFSVSEDGPAQTAGNVLANDSDPGNDPLSVTAVNGQALDVGQLVSLPSGAIVQINADGTFSYDPNGAFETLSANQQTTDTVTYEVSDGDGGTDSATATFTILGDNDAPDAVDDTVAANDLTPISGNVLDDNGNGPDADPDLADVLTVSAVNGEAGDVGNQVTLASGALLTLNADGTFDYDPNGAVTGQPTDTFDYTITDGQGGFDTATVTLNIAASNQPPVAQDDAISADEDAGATGSILADNGNGPDSDPNADMLTVTQINGQAANVGAAVLLSGGGEVTVNSDGTFLFASNGQYESLAVGQTATETFTYTIQDGNGGSDQATVEITINGANDAVDAILDTASTDEDSGTSGNVLTNDVDLDGDTLTVIEVGGSALAVGQPVAGSNGGVFVINADGSYTFDTNGDFESLDTGVNTQTVTTYQVSDGNSGQDTVELTVSITGVNDAPDAVDDDLIVSEIGILNGNLLNDNGNGADTDPDFLDLPVVTEVDGQSASIGNTITLASGALLTVNASGTFTYDPNGVFSELNGGETATETFTYTIEDNDGATDTASVTITINGNESTPVATDDTNTTDEETVVNGTVLGNDNDGDNDPLSVSAVNGQAGDVGSQVILGSGALLTLNADGSYSYDPNGQFESLAVGESTTDSFDYTVSDGNGGTDTASVTITINGVNDAPVAFADGLATDEATMLADNLFLNNGNGPDFDPDGSDALTVSEVNGEAGDVGTQIALTSGAFLTVQSDGSVAYDPNGQFEFLGVGETATDIFTYTISDGNGGTSTTTATVQISGVNDAPDAVDDGFNIGVDAVLNGNVLDDNGNGPDSDPDANDTLAVTELNGTGAALGVATLLSSGALVTLNADGTFAYDQNGAFSGLGVGQTATDTFDYTISDGRDGTDVATVTIVIGGTNQPPVGVADSGPGFETDEDNVFTTASVLANDTDPNADTLSVAGLDTTGTIGLVTDNGDG